MSPIRYLRHAVSMSAGTSRQVPLARRREKLLLESAATAGSHYRPSIAFLRVAAACAVVALHVAGRGLVDAPYGSASWWIADFYRAATCWCVPVFVMISGALLLNPQKPQPPGVFYRKRMSRVLIPLVFWTLFYLGLRARIGDVTWPEAVRDVVRAGPYGHLWFLYMIAGLYFLTPLLQPFVRSVPLREQAWIIFSLVAGASAYDLISQLTNGFGKKTMFSLFVIYVPYYLCGSLLYRTTVPARRVKHYALGALAAWLAIALGTGVLYPHPLVSFYLQNWHNPLTVVLSVTVFLALVGFFQRRGDGAAGEWKIVRYLDSMSLGIYLIHPLFIFLLKEQHQFSERIAQWPAVSIPVMTLLLILASILLTSFLKAIPVVRRIV